MAAALRAIDQAPTEVIVIIGAIGSYNFAMGLLQLVAGLALSEQQSVPHDRGAARVARGSVV
ncbi:MAG: hypothetical protein SFX73_17300 [Kofleriaceae bacterium]|nr:hypothetical protein [Kofleriaceae bacterium]